MIRTRVENLKEGDVLAYPVIDEAGRVLIGAGIPLKAIVIKRLKELGFNYVYVEAPGFEDVERLEMISQNTELEIIKTSKDVFGKIKRTQELDPQKIQHLAVTVINEILSKKNIAIVIDDLMVSSDYLFRHLARTMLFCSILGISMGYSENKLRDLAKAAFLHDIGFAFIDESIRNKKGKLSPEEIETIKQHPKLADVILSKNKFSSAVRKAVLQHHERFDGSGYPSGLKGEEIFELARVIAVIDVFEAMTSDTPYRKALFPSEVYEYVMSQSGKLFDPEIVKLFSKKIIIYPTGTSVILSNNLVGVVKSINPSYPLRPVVKVFAKMSDDGTVTYLERDMEIDLLKTLDVVIVGSTDLYGNIIDYERDISVSY
ncbi:metal dependent phosphohydrolase [Thermodesulfobium narugense DSM 14796]|uniref:Metal dependent phosphohydrolase n=1 Tax=Thermodesulfobium narugense DSM 14796 TaxID=747365 RepID=M1E488_9BACT|nr:HD-GYP domain-containing protein [Thermodesulfobium narugense]AEE13822.1 metal dependent phosphohydrolase [Thermodesulfobium narugense DSM 14796]